MKKVVLIFVLIFSFAIVFSAGGYALTIVGGDLNKVINLPTSNVVGVPKNTPRTELFDYLKKNYSDEYLSIVKFPVLPGEKYTLYIKYPIDGIDRSYSFTGSSPTKSKGGSTSFQVPEKSMIDYYKCNALTLRINITISPESNSPLYVIYTTRSPNIPATLILKHPADPDTVVEKPAPYPGCNSKAKFSWGSVWKNPILLVKDPNISEGEEVKDGMKFTGTWIQKNNLDGKLSIKKLGNTYFVSLMDGQFTIRGTGLLYKNTLIGTFVSQRDSVAGNLKISLEGGELVFYAFSLNCELRWKKVYSRRK